MILTRTVHRCQSAGPSRGLNHVVPFKEPYCQGQVAAQIVARTLQPGGIKVRVELGQLSLIVFMHTDQRTTGTSLF